LDLLAQADVRLSSLYVSDSTLDAEIKESAERIEDEIRVLEAKLRELDEKIAVMNGLDEKVEAILRNADVQGKVHGAGNSVVF
jgi:chaperonin cofactor prefoldin